MSSKYLKDQYKNIKVGALVYNRITDSYRIITEIIISPEGKETMIRAYEFGYGYEDWSQAHYKHQIDFLNYTVYYPDKK